MWEVKIERDRLNDVIEMICADYCKYPDICETQERLSRHCDDECPLLNITCDEYWEKKDIEE